MTLVNMSIMVTYGIKKTVPSRTTVQLGTYIHVATRSLFKISCSNQITSNLYSRYIHILFSVFTLQKTVANKLRYKTEKYMTLKYVHSSQIKWQSFGVGCCLFTCKGKESKIFVAVKQIDILFYIDLFQR